MTMPANIHAATTGSFRGASRRGVDVDKYVPVGDPLPDEAYAIALNHAIRLLSPDDRKRLEAYFQMTNEDLVIEQLSVEIARRPNEADQELGIRLSAKIAKELSAYLATVPLMTEEALADALAVEVSEELAKKGGWWSRVKDKLADLPGVKQYKEWREAKKERIKAQGLAVVAGITQRFDALFEAYGINREQFHEVYKQDPDLAWQLLVRAMTSEARTSAKLASTPTPKAVHDVYDQYGPIVLEQLAAEAKMPKGWPKTYGYRFATHVTDRDSAAQILSSGKMLPQKWGILSGAVPQVVESVGRLEFNPLTIWNNAMNRTRAWVFASDERLGWDDMKSWDLVRSSILVDEIEAEGKRKGWDRETIEELKKNYVKKVKRADTAVSVLAPSKSITKPWDWKAMQFSGHEVGTMLQGVDLYGKTGAGSVRNLKESEMLALRSFIDFKGTVDDRFVDATILGGMGSLMGGMLAVGGAAALPFMLGCAGTFVGLYSFLPRLINWSVQTYKERKGQRAAGGG